MLNRSVLKKVSTRKATSRMSITGQSRVALATARVCSSPWLLMASHREPCSMNITRKKMAPAMP